MVFTIKKGRHHSGNFIYKFFNFFNFTSSIFYRVTFNQSCKYEIEGEDMYDINKLVGFSRGLHHKDSARFGWRYSSKGDCIELFAYCYVSGNRTYKKMCDIELNREAVLEISKVKNYYIFRVFHGISTYVFTVDTKCKFPIGYSLWPYFGGNLKAPHDMVIELEII
jgi:hypothetical protein